MTLFNKLFSFFFMIFLLTAVIESSAQNYKTGFVTTNFIDSSRNNRVVNCRIHYPSVLGGENSDCATGEFPAISLGHGFLMTTNSYYHIADTFASRGYVVILVNTELSISPSHLNFGKDLAFVLTAFEKLSNDPGTLFYKHFSGKKAVIGHSMGGGASFLALAQDPTIHCIANFAAAETTPSAIQAASLSNQPCLVFGGTGDCVVPLTGVTTSMYNAMQSDCKWLVGIKGGSHCKFALQNAICSLGETNCQGSITMAKQHEIVFRYLIPFLEAWLKNNFAGWQTAVSAGPLDIEIDFTENPGCSLTSIPKIDDPATVVSRLYVKGSHLIVDALYPGDAMIFSVDGKVCYSGKIETGENSISLENFSADLFIVKVNTRLGLYVSIIVKK